MLTTYFDILIAYNDVIRARDSLQYGNLDVKVGQTHKGAQHSLSLHPWSLAEIKKKKSNKKNQTIHAIINFLMLHENNPIPGNRKVVIWGKRIGEIQQN